MFVGGQLSRFKGCEWLYCTHRIPLVTANNPELGVIRVGIFGLGIAKYLFGNQREEELQSLEVFLDDGVDEETDQIKRRHRGIQSREKYLSENVDGENVRVV